MGGCEVGHGRKGAVRGCAVEIGIMRGCQWASMWFASSESQLPARTYGTCVDIYGALRRV